MNREHIVAVVEPTPEGEATLDIAHEVAGRGGRATVVVLLDGTAHDDIRAFSESEDLSLGEGQALFIDRLLETYEARVGGEVAAVLGHRSWSGRKLFAEAAEAEATAVALPARLASRPGWRTSTSRSRVPVVITPRRAA